MLRRSGGLIAVVVALAALPAGATAATTFHVAPNGAGETCSADAPCQVQKGLMLAASGDTVLMATDRGSYGTAGTPLASELQVPTGVTLAGEGGKRAEVISNASSAAIRLGGGGAGQRLADVAVLEMGVGEAVVGSGTIERVAAIGANPLAGGCRIDGTPTTIVNSVCAGKFGIFDILSPGFGSGPFAITLRNDTIYGADSGLVGYSEGPQFQITATNTIFYGVDEADIETGEQTGGTVTVTLDHSNFDSALSTNGGTVTAPGSPTNQTAAPQFVGAATGDFRELASSPTVDAGLNDPANGSFDLLGNLRVLASRVFCSESVPALTDIGATEFVPETPNCAPPPPPSPPATSLLLSRVKAHRASFRFAAAGTGPFRFECKLDRRKFRPCSSPRVYKRLGRGAHRFAVRAIGAGGTDPTPATRRFRIGR